MFLVYLGRMLKRARQPNLRLTVYHVESKRKTKSADEHYPRRMQRAPACYSMKPAGTWRSVDDWGNSKPFLAKKCRFEESVDPVYAAYKIMSQILFCRLVPFATNFVGSYQAGLVHHHRISISTTHQFFTLRLILHHPHPPSCTTCLSTSRWPTTVMIDRNEL